MEYSTSSIFQRDSLSWINREILKNFEKYYIYEIFAGLVYFKRSKRFRYSMEYSIYFHFSFGSNRNNTILFL